LRATLWQIDKDEVRHRVTGDLQEQNVLLRHARLGLFRVVGVPRAQHGPHLGLHLGAVMYIDEFLFLRHHTVEALARGHLDA